MMSNLKQIFTLSYLLSFSRSFFLYVAVQLFPVCGFRLATSDKPGRRAGAGYSRRLTTLCPKATPSSQVVLEAISETGMYVHIPLMPVEDVLEKANCIDCSFWSVFLRADDMRRRECIIEVSAFT